MKRNLYLLISLLCLIQSLYAQTWISQGVGLLPHGYEVKSISVVSEHILWVSSGVRDQSNYPIKVFRSIDAGQSWSGFDISGCQGCTVTAIEGVDANIAWLSNKSNSGDGQLYKTEDGGQHWNLKWTGGPAGGHIQLYDSTYMACYTNEKIGWSEDGGETWETGVIAESYPSLWPYSEGPGPAAGDTSWYGMTGDMYFSPVNTSARLIKTTDNGRTFDFINCGLDSIAAIELISFSNDQSGLMKYTPWIEGYDPDLLYYGFVFSDQDYLAHTLDGGDSWASVPAPFSKINAIHSIPGSIATYMIAGNESFPKISWTNNSGQSWEHHELADPVCCMEFINPSKGWAAINGTSVEAPLVIKWNGDFTSDVENIKNSKQSILNAYPNPIQDVIHYTLGHKEATIHTRTLTDITGHVLFEQKTDKQELNIAHLQTGMYFLFVQYDGQTEVARIIKQ